MGNTIDYERQNWFDLIDKLANEDEDNNQNYIGNYKIYQTKSGNYVNLDNLDNKCLRNCLNYIKRTITYHNREKYIEIIEKILWYRIISVEKKSEDYYNKFLKGEI